eukprot:scaffold7378_cov71-Skeletonema_dohrnii-CCMP3373.AAC.1
MTFSLLPKKQPALPTAKQQKHNRNVTPHTASLMSLFARPASTPLTPLTPPDSELIAAEESIGGSLICDASAPSLPEEDEGEDEQESVASHSYNDSYNDNEHEESTTPKNSNNSYTAATTAAIRNYSGERAPLLPTPPLSLGRQKTEVCSNKTSAMLSAAANDYHSMISHNRDDTHLIDNLSNHNQQQQQQQQHYQQQSWMAVGKRTESASKTSTTSMGKTIE